MVHTILTHAGTFHADEVLAAAFLKLIFPSADIVRTYTPSTEQFADPNCIILDIGRQYDIDLNNFDHHQNKDLDATNMLILNRYYFEANLSEREKDYLVKYLFGYVSKVDTGAIVEQLECAPTINSLIRGLNNLKSGGFNKALELASIAIDSAIETARRRSLSEDKWAIVDIFGGYAVWDSPEHLVGWHELAEADGVKFLITPNIREAGSYQITSRDSEKYNIPIDPRQTFRHNSGFLAAYKNRQDAIDHATELVLAQNNDASREI